MKRKAGIFFYVVGILFLAFAIFGRYLVLPGYFKSLDAGLMGAGIPDNVPILLVLRYLLWAFSFKFGIYFFVIGAMIRAERPLAERIIFASVGLFYISIAYMDWPFDSSLFFGIGGGILTILFLILFTGIGTEKNGGASGKTTFFLYLGYFFLAMAAYNLCPFCGVKCFALYPEKMIQYGLQEQARSFANHIMSELVLGWLFVVLSRFNISREKRNS